MLVLAQKKKAWGQRSWKAGVRSRYDAQCYDARPDPKSFLKFRGSEVSSKLGAIQKHEVMKPVLRTGKTAAVRRQLLTPSSDPVVSSPLQFNRASASQFARNPRPHSPSRGDRLTIPSRSPHAGQAADGFPCRWPRLLDNHDMTIGDERTIIGVKGDDQLVREHHPSDDLRRRLRFHIGSRVVDVLRDDEVAPQSR